MTYVQTLCSLGSSWDRRRGDKLSTVITIFFSHLHPSSSFLAIGITLELIRRLKATQYQLQKPKGSIIRLKSQHSPTSLNTARCAGMPLLLTPRYQWGIEVVIKEQRAADNASMVKVQEYIHLYVALPALFTKIRSRACWHWIMFTCIRELQLKCGLSSIPCTKLAHKWN